MNTFKYNDSKLKTFLQTLTVKPIGYLKKTHDSSSVMPSSWRLYLNHSTGTWVTDTISWPSGQTHPQSRHMNQWTFPVEMNLFPVGSYFCFVTGSLQSPGWPGTNRDWVTLLSGVGIKGVDHHYLAGILLLTPVFWLSIEKKKPWSLGNVTSWIISFC